MKKLVLFATIFAAVALTACNQKKETPAIESAVEEQTEIVSEPETIDQEQEEVPSDSTSVEVVTE